MRWFNPGSSGSCLIINASSHNARLSILARTTCALKQPGETCQQERQTERPGMDTAFSGFTSNYFGKQE